MKKIILMALIAALIPAMAAAAVPKLVTYQGILKDGSGSLLTGSYNLTFRVYNSVTGGTALWNETQTVSVSSGRFSIQLGAVSSLNLDFSQDYWLSVQVNTDAEMAPRQRFTSAGYALMAEQVVNGFTQAQHDALSHKNIEGVKANTSNLAKTNFKLDAFTQASANNLGSLIIDSFNDAAGVDAAASSNYIWRGSPDFDLTVAQAGGTPIQQSGTETDFWEILSNQSAYYNGAGQQFRHTAQVAVDRIGFKWCRFGSPSGNVRVRLYSDNAGVPGALLGESANINVAQIAAVYPSYEEFTAPLASPVTLQANTPYHAVIENVNATGDGSNHVNVRRASGGNPYSAGVPVTKTAGGAWQAQADAYDTYFKVYQQASPAPAAVKSVAFSVAGSPAEVMVMADETLNSGTIAYSVSRDNGTTWTVCPRNAVTNISAQPSGNQIKWKATISGDAELDSLAIAL